MDVWGAPRHRVVGAQLLLPVRGGGAGRGGGGGEGRPRGRRAAPTHHPTPRSCGNVAAIMELDGALAPTFKVFDAAPSGEGRGAPAKKPAPDYFL